MKIIQVHPSGWGFREQGGGAAFTPWGCNYYDPETGWPPQIWTRFDPGRVRAHFGQIRDQGFHHRLIEPAEMEVGEMGDQSHGAGTSTGSAFGRMR